MCYQLFEIILVLKTIQNVRALLSLRLRDVRFPKAALFYNKL